jgi:hypothetical protein
MVVSLIIVTRCTLTQTPQSLSQPTSTHVRGSLCWPAMHVTLQVLNYEVRFRAVRAMVRTTMCTSRAVQI